MVQQLHVLLRPVVTEKSTLLQEQNKYVFAVSLNATKVMIRQPVESAFDVTVTAVRTVKNRGKMKRFGPKYKRTPDRKKAIVTLKQGDRIQIFEGA